ncbi:MAG: DUF1501 domain-containing protein [Phycisphaera sp.]|nr:DUF1501 domain-containing protein [Phycisphaera sp.]
MNDQTIINAQRRTFLGHSFGLGATALASMLTPSMLRGATGSAKAAPSDGLYRGVVNPRHFAPKAKRVIFLCMAGGPSHLETFDHKPKLDEMHGKPFPESYTAGMPIAQLQGKQLLCQKSMIEFHRHGQSGQLISDYMPHTATIADDISIIRSMHTEQINHDPAHTFMNTGTAISGRPSMGAWVLYGLGADCNDLPGFVVLTSIKGRNPQPIASRQWSAGFLPSRFQGVPFHSSGDPVHYLGSPAGYNASRQRDVIDASIALNHLRNEQVANPEIDTRISQYEMAFRMQGSVPELMDISNEPKHILDMYGADSADGSFAYNCLLARRLAERGVRFIHLYHRGWDHHGDLDRFMKVCCGATDQPTAALVKDLKQRGMLDDTLIIWGGEFGRTPMFQGKGSNPGRDHHIKGFSVWMAGGGIKGGTSYGETDELGYAAAINPVHVRDLHATMLHQLGIDNERLSIPFQGLDVRLTGVEKAKVLHDIIA